MWVLIAISLVLLVLGFVKGFPATVAEDNGTVDLLLNWAYIILGLAVACVIIVGIVIAAINDPKSLVKLLVGLVAIAAVCFVVYLLSKSSVPLGYHGEIPSDGTLKLVDTVLNLTYLSGALAILSIVVGEIIGAIRNK